jgi:hypothetical protein
MFRASSRARDFSDNGPKQSEQESSSALSKGGLGFSFGGFEKVSREIKQGSGVPFCPRMC